MTANGTSREMTVPDVAGMSVVEAALCYADHGWFVGPVRRGTKDPGSLLGAAWQTKTSRDPAVIRAWYERWPDAGVFLHAGRSGAWIADIDHPEHLPDVLREAISEERPPWQNTRPAEPHRRHYVFAQPPGRDLGNGRGGLGKAWGEARGRNGVIVVAPSVHPEPGGWYSWGRVGVVPVLPNYVAALLPDADAPGASIAVEEVDAWLAGLPTGEADEAVLRVLRDAEGAFLVEASRHEVAMRHVLRLARLGGHGYSGVPVALDTLQTMFYTSLNGDRAAGAPDEFRRMVAGAVAIVVANPDSSPEEDFAGLSDPFWDATPTLRHIQQAAHARLLSAPMVLANVLLHVLLEVPRGWKLPPVVGAPRPLNLGVVMVGSSSAGKTSGREVSEEVLGLFHDQQMKPLGSGEGLVDAYLAGKGDNAYLAHTALLFYADEGETYRKLSERSGATLGGYLRTALSTGTLGTTNAKAGGRNRLVSNVRCCLSLAFQPSNVGILVAEEGAGTPQRCLFVDPADPAKPRIRAEVPEWPGELAWGFDWELSDWTSEPQRMLDYPEHIKDAVVAHQLRMDTDPDADPAEGHALLLQLKVAAALAFLHLEPDITDRWWELAGVLTAESRRVYGRCKRMVAAEAAKSNAQRGAAEAHREIAKQDVMRATTAVRQRVAENLVRHAREAGDEGITRGALRKRIRAEDRDEADRMLAVLLETGQLRTEDDEHRGQPVQKVYYVDGEVA